MAPRNTSSATGTVASDYGPLTLRKADYNRDLELPDMSIETGDLTIKLSNYREDWLLVHSEVVAASSPMLAASLSAAWAKTAQRDTIKHPTTGEERLVRSLALKQVDGAFFLEGKDVDLGEEEDSVVVQHSTWSQPGWPELDQAVNVLCTTTHALCILFALFYGAQLSADQISGKKDIHRAGIFYLNNEVLDTVCTVCAYAEYFGCGDKIKQGIVRAMQSAPGYWVAVVDSPKRHIMMAARLQLKEVYLDAPRHMVAKEWRFNLPPADWSDVAEVMGKTEDEVRAFFEPQTEEMPNVLAKLNVHLLRLSLEPVQMNQSRAYSYTAFTTFMNALQFKFPGRSQATKANETAAFVARTMWSQWYIGSYYGEELERNQWQGIYTKNGPQNLNRIIQTLQKAATVHDPSHIFGAATPAHLATLFNLGGNVNGFFNLGGHTFDAAKAIKHHLRVIVAEANRVILDVFSPDVEVDGVFGCCFYGRADFDVHNAGYFTYMKVPGKVPRVEKKRASGDGEGDVGLPRVDMRDASEEWIEAVGEALGAEDEEDGLDDIVASM